jgi:hypothetical protein
MLGRSNDSGLDRLGMKHVWHTLKMHNKIVFRKLKGKSSLGRYMRKWEDNIKMFIEYMVY